MSNIVKSVVIVGGGTAGWITAGVLAARFQSRILNGEMTITLCESPTIPTIGVGEGTWPTMPSTLKSIGISETDFIRECEASFKQGSKFIGWGKDDGQDVYYHPFDVPAGSLQGVIAEHWLHENYQQSFADLFTVQDRLGDANLAPKTIATAEFSSIVNYGYHLNAGAFSIFLQKHCVQKLGVKHLLDDVEKVNLTDCGSIKSVLLKKLGEVQGDLFIDCTGFKSLLLGEALGVKFKPVDDVLFADTALAAQVPYLNNNSPIASFTKSTAQSAGWIWDIGLPSRRGVGHVFSSKHTTKEQAETDLLQYITASGGDTSKVSIREINFTSGHREKFWHKNCVAIGLSAGFLEPLEASALVLVELSAKLITEQFPSTDTDMAILAKRFNTIFTYRWGRAIDFLKLHYILSERTTPFWLDNKKAESIPERLQELMQLWQHNVPTVNDFEPMGELFQAPSYQFVLYGSSFKSKPLFKLEQPINNYIMEQIKQTKAKQDQLLTSLPSNRELIEKIHKYGLSKI